MTAKDAAEGLLPVSDAGDTMRYAGRMILRHRFSVASILTMYALTAVAGMGAPWLIGHLIDTVDEGGTALVNTVGLAATGCIVVHALFTIASRIMAGRLSEKVMGELRNELVRDSLRLPMERLNADSTADLMGRGTADTNILNGCVRTAAPEIAISLVTAVVITGGLLLLNPLLALALIPAAILIGVPTRWAMKRTREANLGERAAFTIVSRGLRASIEGAGTVSEYRLGGLVRDRSNKDIADAWGKARWNAIVRCVIPPGIDASVITVLVSGLLIGGALHSGGRVGVGEVVTALLLLRQLFDPLTMVLVYLHAFLVGGASLSRIIGVGQGLDSPGEREPRYESGPGKVELDRLSLTFPGGNTGVDDVSLIVDAGTTVAVVGASGAGKTTLGRVVAGLAAPTAGSVRIDGDCLHSLPQESRRDLAVMVSQEAYVFAASLRDNVRLAAPDVGDDVLATVLKEIFGDAWLGRLPEGLDTPLGAGGESLSPAETQLLSLARVAISTAPVVVLDEATSQLGESASRALERLLDGRLRGRTVINIAHRLEHAVAAERVLVMEEGRIVEDGPHRELAAAQGTYQRLWESQARPAVVAPPSSFGS